MNEGIKRLIKNLQYLQRLPIKRFPWKIEMIVLDINCELDNFIKIYNELDKEKKLEHLKK